MTTEADQRNRICRVKRVVVKVGSRLLVQSSGRPEPRRIRSLVRDLAWLHHRGCEVTLVSSGAIGAGMAALKMKRRPVNLPDLQMAGAVGQISLMARYAEYFQGERCRIGQVLLTHDDLNDRRRHLNARHTIMNLLHNGIIPVVNENDAVAVDEIKLGDNDVLASLVALLVRAEALVLLTTADGLRAPRGVNRTRRIPCIEHITGEIAALASGKGSELSSGGMGSKLQAAQQAARAGIMSVIADGRKPGILRRVMAGEDVGTLLLARGGESGTFPGRKRWIAFFHRPSGAIEIDEGATRALETKGRSLLPIGVRAIKGSFPIGAVVNIYAPDGRLVARGLVDYNSRDLDLIKGRRTEEIAGLLGRKDYDTVIHRDNMVLLRTRKGEVT